MRKPIYIFFLLILTSVLVGCNFLSDKNPIEDEYTQVRNTLFPMDTILDIVVQTEDEQLANKAIKAAKEEINRLETKLSATIETSEVSLINQNAGIEPVKVSKETFELIQKGLRYAEITKGKFDITIAPLLNLYDWREGMLTGTKPEEEKVKAAKELVNYRDVILDEDNMTAYLSRPGMEIDLGGIAKGYIIDRAVDILKEFGLEFGYVNGGGDIRFLGSKYDGTPWRIGVDNPRGEGNIAVIPVSANSVVTSGDYQRFYMTQEGERIHHIIDPHTGTSGAFAQSVTVIAENATIADILSTAFFMFPAQESIKMAYSLGVEVLIVTSDGEILMTQEMNNMLTVTQ